MEINKKINILKIDFISKKIAYKNTTKVNKSKYAYEGIAFYIFDENYSTILKQIPYLISGEYRINDSRMFENKGYSKNNRKKRKEIFGEKIIKLSTTDETIIKKLTNENIKEINNLSWNTILNIDGFLTGSNPTGADSDASKSPIMMKNTLWNFTNVFKHSFKIKNNLNLNYSFEELKKNADKFEIFKNNLNEKHKFHNYFWWFNVGLFNDDKKNLISEKNFEKLKLENKIIFSIKRRTKINTEIIINKFKKGLLTSKQMETKLRKIFFVNIHLEKKEKIEKNDYKGFIEECEYLGELEGAHIIPVKKLIKNDQFEEVADHNNGLLLTPNFHRSLDNGTIKIIKKEESYFLKFKKKTFKIKDIFLTKERIKFLDSRIKIIEK